MMDFDDDNYNFDEEEFSDEGDYDGQPSKVGSFAIASLQYGMKAFQIFQTAVKYLWVPGIVLAGVSATDTDMLSILNPFSNLQDEEEPQM